MYFYHSVYQQLKFCYLVSCAQTRISFYRPKAKTHPQDTLLKLEKDQSFRESSQESSLFVFKLGMAKLGCSLLMNGLVHSSNEVLFLYYFFVGHIC